MIRINLATLAHTFETETCSRCGGCGRYSYCQMYGSVCFGCHGAKNVMTRRGKLAWSMFNELLSKRADQLVPGDKIKESNFFTSQRWFLVTEVSADTTKASTLQNGVMVEVTGMLHIATDGCGFGGVSPDHIYRVAATVTQKRLARRKALAYQLTLTKTGKKAR